MIVGILTVVLLFQTVLIYVLLSNAIISLIIAGATHCKMKSCLNYSFRELYTDIFPSLAMSLVMMLLILLLGNLQINRALLLIIQILIGGVIYVGMSLLTKNKNFIILKDYIMFYVKRRRNNG